MATQLWSYKVKITQLVGRLVRNGKSHHYFLIRDKEKSED